MTSLILCDNDVEVDARQSYANNARVCVVPLLLVVEATQMTLACLSVSSRNFRKLEDQGFFFPAQNLRQKSVALILWIHFRTTFYIFTPRLRKIPTYDY